MPKSIDVSEKYWRKHEKRHILVPHRKLHYEEKRFLDKLVDAAPYYLLKYGDKALGLLEVKLIGTPIVVLVIKGLRRGLKWVNKRFVLSKFI